MRARHYTGELGGRLPGAPEPLTNEPLGALKAAIGEAGVQRNAFDFFAFQTTLWSSKSI